MTQRLELYSESLQRAIRADFKPQIVVENSSSWTEGSVVLGKIDTLHAAWRTLRTDGLISEGQVIIYLFCHGRIHRR